MNIWTQKSIELANQKNYLDLLYKVYPLSINLRRALATTTHDEITSALKLKDGKRLLKILLEQEVFPLKDSYVAYLRLDSTSIDRNPNTVGRIASLLYDMGYDEIVEKTTVPKETNRQIGPLFGNWVRNNTLGAKVTMSQTEFIDSPENMIFDGSDEERTSVANKHLGYNRQKGLDFLAKFNSKYVIGEAKFLSDFGGSQNSDFEDAVLTLRAKLSKTKHQVEKIAIIDGVLYIDSRAGRKPAKNIRSDFNDSEVIISAVLLRDYLYSL